MKVLAARVNEAQVVITSEVVSSINKGLALFVGIEREDDKNALDEMAQRIVDLRIFEDADGKMNYSVKEKGYSILCVPNFTLCADTANGNRPSFDNALGYKKANELFDNFISKLAARGVLVEPGVFGAYMDIKLDLDGPVNIVLESEKGCA